MDEKNQEKPGHPSFSSATEGFSGSYSLVDQHYDEYGRVTAVSEPRFSGTTNWNRTEYDDLGRVTQVDTAAGVRQIFSYEEAATDIVTNMNAYANSINLQSISYWVTGPNSNSYAFSYVVRLGFDRPTPALDAPGWDSEL